MLCLCVRYTATAALWFMIIVIGIKSSEAKLKTTEELPKPLKVVTNLQKALYAQDFGYSVIPIPNKILNQVKPAVTTPKSDNARVGRGMGRGFMGRRPGRSRRKRPYRPRSNFGLQGYASAYKQWMPVPMRRPMGMMGRRPMRFKNPKIRMPYYHMNLVEPLEDYMEPEVMPEYEDEYEVMMHEPEAVYDPEEMYDDMPRSPSRNVYSYQRDEDFMHKHADLYANGFNPGHKSRSTRYRTPLSVMYSSKYRSTAQRDREEEEPPRRDPDIEATNFESDAPLTPMALRGSPDLYKRSKKEDPEHRYLQDDYRTYKDVLSDEPSLRMNDAEVIMGRSKHEVPSWTGSVKFVPRPFAAAIGAPSRTVVPREKHSRFTESHEEKGRELHDKDYLYDIRTDDSPLSHRLLGRERERDRERVRVYRSSPDRLAYRKPTEDARSELRSSNMEDARVQEMQGRRYRDPEYKKYVDAIYTRELQELYSRGHKGREYESEERKTESDSQTYLANHKKSDQATAAQGMEIVIDDGVAGWKVGGR
nr:PREDICTED: uncharacterized protein LOC109037525 [Bemisia tabaci]